MKIQINDKNGKKIADIECIRNEYDEIIFVKENGANAKSVGIQQGIAGFQHTIEINLK